MTLRKIILTLAATATASAVMAQSALLDTSRPQKTVEIGISVGDGINTITQNISTAVPDVTEFSLTPGNRFTAGLTALMPIRRFFGIGTEYGREPACGICHICGMLVSSVAQHFPRELFCLFYSHFATP